MNKPSDEIVAKWREEFESTFLAKYPKYVICDYDCEANCYLTPYVDGCWQGFLMGRSTAVIELPEPSGSFLPEGYGYDSALFDCVEKIESQGYSVKRSE